MNTKTPKNFPVTLEELLYYITFSLLLATKGIGLEEGGILFRCCLLLAILLTGCKVLLGKYSIWEIALTCLLGIWGIATFFITGSFGMLIYLLLIVGMKNVSVKRTFLCGTVTWGCCLFFSFTAAIFFGRTGLQIVHDKLGLDAILRESLGYTHPNVLHITYLIFMAFILYTCRLEKKKQFLLILGLFAGDLFVFMYSLSSTGLLSSFILLLFYFYFRYRQKISIPERIGIQCLLPLCVLLSVICPKLLNSDGPLYTFLNKLLNNRIWAIRYYYDHYELRLFGMKWLESERTLDNSFVYALMSYGVIFFCIILAAYALLIHECLKKDRRMELVLICTFLVSGLSEQFLFNGSVKNITVLFLGHLLYQKFEKQAHTLPLLSKYNIVLTISTEWFSKLLGYVKYLFRKKAVCIAGLCGILLCICSFLLNLFCVPYDTVYVNERLCQIEGETVALSEGKENTLYIGLIDPSDRYYCFTRKNSPLIRIMDYRQRIAYSLYMALLILIFFSIGFYLKIQKNRQRTSFELLACKVFILIFILLVGTLFTMSLFITGVNYQPLSNEHSQLLHESPIINILKIFLFLVYLYIAGKCYDLFLSKINIKHWIFMACLFSFLFSVYWVFMSKIRPFADPQHIIDAAVEFENGSFHALKQGNYVSIYQQQLGMITILRGLFKLFGIGNYQAFQYMVCMFIPFGIYSGSKIAEYLSGSNNKTVFLYLVLMISFIPMYIFTPMVYGDLLATILVIILFRYIIFNIEKKSIIGLIPVFILSGLCSQIKQNTLICIIAVSIVIFIKLLSKKEKRFLFLLAAVWAGVFFFQKSIDIIYQEECEGQSMPAIMWIAMGLNDDHDAGYYNAYNINTFAENDFQSDNAAKAAKKYIKERVKIFREQPAYASDFFFRKINLQWNVPYYQSISACLTVTEDPGKIIESVYYRGKPGRFLEQYMTAYQKAGYGLLLFCCFLQLFRKKWAIEKYLPMIAMLGGFLFSCMWETKAKYNFIYILPMIPYLAYSFCEAELICKNIIASIPPKVLITPTHKYHGS